MASEQTTRRDWLRSAAIVGGAMAGGRAWEAAAMAEANKGPRIVDPHVHVWKNDPRYPWPADLASPPKDDALPETLLGLMAAHGVAHTVIVHVIYYRWDCRYAADAVKAHPGKFQGVCRINPESAEPAAELDRWTSAGFHGVRLSPALGPGGEWINDAKQMETSPPGRTVTAKSQYTHRRTQNGACTYTDRTGPSAADRILRPRAGSASRVAVVRGRPVPAR
jgi:hypothetical protein